ncbi:hypothetical protein KJ750_03175, partial [Patescibacteria group bacterium]|nr:hypothetical protein [Patescibacteria group bacterium]
KNLIIVGKNKDENNRLKRLKQKNDILLMPDFLGPSVLIRGRKINQGIIEEAQKLIKKYSKKM